MFDKKKFIEQMAELDDAAQGVYVVPVPEEEREAAFEETRKAIEIKKKLSYMPKSKD
jgi:hypothetical protein